MSLDGVRAIYLNLLKRERVAKIKDLLSFGPKIQYLGYSQGFPKYNALA